MTEASGPTIFQDAVAEAIAEHGGESDQAEGGGETQAPIEPEGEITAPPENIEAPPVQLVRVKVNGVETEIPLDEAISGYQRQQDYTSKTQELAAERERLAQAEAVIAALQEDPQGTIEWLREQFDVDDTPQVNPEDLDPYERDLLEVKSFMQQQQEAQFEAEIRSEVDRINEQYGDSVSFEELLQHATDREIPNLEVAYRDLAFGRTQPTAVEDAAEARRAAEDAAAEEAKRAAAVVEGGTSRSQGNLQVGGRPASVREAFAQAAQEHGVDL